MKDGKKCTAVVLSAGSGNRMKNVQNGVAKQYMDLGGKPVICYSLQAVEASSVIDDCILVVGAEDVEFATKEIIEKYHFSKTTEVIVGGAERYLSVRNALRVIEKRCLAESAVDGYVFIHDGARPFLTESILERLADAVVEARACVAAMPAKDTVKIVDDHDLAIQTPDRRTVWNVQTPQVFETGLILTAYERLEGRLERMREQGIAVTDDAGVVELFTDCRVKMVKGSYRNIKITTPEDMIVAEAFLKNTADQ
ncbi:MAG: 2-C-methyl-D-erythritol 4-phosphate cytidylyltransferase [Lachnospiraceae bacterium]|nr:2-C-methyl-D-erythritol 4-phosphate cytidylyltransferase [Lachnospiraceae bacterium]